MDNITVIYHADCPDGFGSAWTAWKALGDTANYLPCRYGDPFPKLPEKSLVYILDFSFPRNVLLEANKSHVLRVIDHHKTAQAALEGLPFAYFDMTKSGAVLSWAHFFPREPVPELLKYVQDRDLWEWKLENSKDVSTYILNQKVDFNDPSQFEKWNALDTAITRDFSDVVTYGNILLDQKNQLIDSQVKQSLFAEIAGHVVPVVFTPLLISDTAHKMCLEFKSPFAAVCFYTSRDGQVIQKWSLRSVGDFDVSAIAKQYKGGGHKNAAGFEIDDSIRFITPDRCAIR